jgi:hypothetical protein
MGGRAPDLAREIEVIEAQGLGLPPQRRQR